MDTLKPKTHKRRRPKGKIPCVAIRRPRVSRTKVVPDLGPKLREWKAEIQTSPTTTGILYLMSEGLPLECTYREEKYLLQGSLMDGTLFYEKDGEGYYGNL